MFTASQKADALSVRLHLEKTGGRLQRNELRPLVSNKSQGGFGAALRFAIEHELLCRLNSYYFHPKYASKHMGEIKADAARRKKEANDRHKAKKAENYKKIKAASGMRANQHDVQRGKDTLLIRKIISAMQPCTIIDIAEKTQLKKGRIRTLVNGMADIKIQYFVKNPAIYTIDYGYKKPEQLGFVIHKNSDDHRISSMFAPYAATNGYNHYQQHGVIS